MQNSIQASNTNPKQLWILLMVFQVITLLMIFETISRAGFDTPTEPPTILTVLGIVTAYGIMIYVAWRLPHFFPKELFQRPRGIKWLIIGFILTSALYRFYWAFGNYLDLNEVDFVGLGVLPFAFVPSNILYGLVFFLFARENKGMLIGSVSTGMTILGIYHIIGGVTTFISIGMFLLWGAAIVDLIVFIVLLSSTSLLAQVQEQAVYPGMQGNWENEQQGKTALPEGQELCPHCNTPATNYGGFCGNCGKALEKSNTT